MIPIGPQTRVLVAVEPVDFRAGIDGLAQVCRAVLQSEPMSGVVFVFRNRRRTSMRWLLYDGQGFCLCTKRLSKGKFRWWPSSAYPGTPLQGHELHVLLRAGDPSSTYAAPDWRRLTA